MEVWKSLFLFVFMFSSVGFVYAQAEGGKAHFQVHNKIQGNMVIKATKMKASVCVLYFIYLLVHINLNKKVRFLSRYVA